MIERSELIPMDYIFGNYNPSSLDNIWIRAEAATKPPLSFSNGRQIS